ncbi:glutamate-5-semialdehyde dehydrogenase [Futiania mangrovi]|uniref:Gamma-glutamyl phosphate reductase n=1 Tax=Futiania mangrovi TaxID=2959716 RepID=A0A9J6PE78_9PROT|nr:glutamate-5-semialdehyde dehydrogenase [Futiania mangrovii]MCP1336710.1 glutamate-5-semialdehyde dehydrogenase [Futiania mangrovii]
MGVRLVDTADDDSLDIAGVMAPLGADARAAARVLATASTDDKNAALQAMADAIRNASAMLVEANRDDLDAAHERGLSPALIDRLTLTPDRVEAMARGIEEIAALPDPVGRTLAEWTRPNGLDIARVATPLGVIGVIYESRPNVTADAGALCLKAGNAVILRGGSDSWHSSRAIHACLVTGLKAAGLPEAAIQVVPTTDRAAVGYMLAEMADTIDVIVPRGGKSLVARVQAEARVPVFAHLEGICHVYVDGDADLDMARQIVLNAKMRRTGICGAAETLLIDKACARTHLGPIVEDLLEAGCEVRGDAAVQTADPRVVPASEEDWSTEYLDKIISAKIVDGVEGAIAHIETYGSHHTEAIVTNDPQTAEAFLNEIDSAILLWNASTQFADGGEFGMGAEIGIATGKLHARGPVGVEQLTSFKYVVRGTGQTRP